MTEIRSAATNGGRSAAGDLAPARDRLSARQPRHRLRAADRGPVAGARVGPRHAHAARWSPHEQAAIAMAHGYWLATGRPLAVMVHVNVGLANTLMGVINAARDNVPLLLLSGRTPFGEGGRTGCARPADPLGPGDARPGRDAARAGEVGLRAAPARAGARADRPGAGDRHEPADGAGLPVAAARGPVRRDRRRHAARDGRASSRRLRPCPAPAAIEEAAAMLAAAAQAAGDHAARRRLPGRLRRAGAASP